jgi:large-conductance mechanosensitive channel
LTLRYKKLELKLSLLFSFFIFLVLISGAFWLDWNLIKKKEEPAPEAGPSSTDLLLMEIRDSLKK